MTLSAIQHRDSDNAQAPQSARRMSLASTEVASQIHRPTADCYSAAMTATPLQLSALDTALLQFRSAVRSRQGGQGQDVQTVAASGMQGAAQALPYLQPIQAAFGRHDVSAVQAYTGPSAAAASKAMGAHAYASDNSVVLGATGQDLHTVAHEAAHVVQQRSGISLKGGLGAAGDVHEQHADAVADRVVQGNSAEALLDRYVGGVGGAGGAIQRSEDDEAIETVEGDEEVREPAELEDIFGDNYEADRDAVLMDYFDAVAKLEAVLDVVADQSPTECQTYQGILDRTGPVAAEDLYGYEDALLEGAYWDLDGTLVADEGLEGDLEYALDTLADAAPLFTEIAEMWGLIVGTDLGEGLVALLEGWVSLLEAYGELAQSIVALLTTAQEMIEAHQEAFETACLKLGLDAALLVGSVAALLLIANPVGGLVAGVGLAVAGICGTLAIEGGVGRFGQVKSGITAANLTNNATKHLGTKALVSVTDEMAVVLKGLGPAMNVLAMVKDGGTAYIEASTVEKLETQLGSIQSEFGNLVTGWPGALACLEAADAQLLKTLTAIDASYGRLTELDTRITERLKDW